MRPADELEERLRILTQALYFSHAHRNELTPEALAKYRALEENIGLLQWCLEPPDRATLTWGAVGRAVRWALGLFTLRLRPQTAHDASCPSKQEPVR